MISPFLDALGEVTPAGVIFLTERAAVSLLSLIPVRPDRACFRSRGARGGLP